MPLIVEAVYENGVLKPAEPLPLEEHASVLVAVYGDRILKQPLRGTIPCTDPRLIEWAATDPELDFPPPPEGA